MHVIDSDGATVGNLFTEGNASLSIPATVVSAAIANAWQEEIANVVREVGIPLLTSSTDTFDQLKDSMIELIQRGGRAAPIEQALANNSGPLDVATMPTFDSSVVKAFKFDFEITRRTDSNSEVEMGTFYGSYNPDDAGAENDKWNFSFDSKLDDAGVVFNIELVAGLVSKLQYTTDDLTGTTYSGTLKVTNFKTFLV